MSAGVVQAVVFDWGGTLTPWHTIDFRDQWMAYARHHARASGRTEEAATDLAEQIMEREREAWLRLRGDGGSARIEEILAGAGIGSDDPAHPAALAAYEEFWEPHTITDPEVRPLWEGLQDRGIRVGVLSNTIWSRAYHEAIFARDGVLDLLDGAVYTSEIAHAKPHVEAFRAALDAVGVSDPAAAVYVGDRAYEDVHGAQQAGLRAVLVPHSDIPAEQQVPVDVQPDAVAPRLLDLLDIVDRWRGPDSGARRRGSRHGPAGRPDGRDPAGRRLPGRVSRRGRRGRRAGAAADAVADAAGRRADPDPRDQQGGLDLRDDGERRDVRAAGSGTDLRTAVPLTALALAGAVGGALTAGLVPKAQFRQVVLLALVVVATVVWLRPALGAEPVPRFHGHRHLLAAGLSGLAIGWYDGAVGPGTGTFLVFTLVGLIGLDFLRASAAAKIANVATNLGALLVFIPQGAPLWRIGLLMGCANLVGGFLGARTALARGARFVRLVFLLVVAVLMVRLGYQIAQAA